MSKFDLFVNPKTIYAGLSVFWQVTLPKGFSIMLRGNMIKIGTIQTLSGLGLRFGLSGFLLTGYSWAQSRTISIKEERRAHYSTLYKPGAVEKIQGEVVSLGKTRSGNGKAWCKYPTLKTSTGNIWVILKSGSYNPKKNLAIQSFNQLEITGARITLP